MPTCPARATAIEPAQATTADGRVESRSARIRAGLERAQARGVRLGRPRVSVDLERVLALRAEGQTHRTIGRALGASASTVSRMLAGIAAASVATKNIRAPEIEARRNQETPAR